MSAALGHYVSTQFLWSDIDIEVEEVETTTLMPSEAASSKVLAARNLASTARHESASMRQTGSAVQASQKPERQSIFAAQKQDDVAKDAHTGELSSPLVVSPHALQIHGASRACNMAEQLLSISKAADLHHSGDQQQLDGLILGTATARQLF